MEYREKPLELLRATYFPNRKLAGLFIRCLYDPEVMHSLSKLFIEHNTKLIFANIVSKNDEAELTVFLDVSEALKSVDEIAEDLMGVNNVREIRIIKPLLNGLLIDTVHFSILFMGRRAWIIGEALSKGLFRDFKREFGDAGRVFLYHLGIDVGRRLYEIYRGYVSSEEEMLELIKALSKASGWGIIVEIRRSVLGKYRIRMRNNIECVVCKPSKRSCGDFSRGILAGIFSKIIGKSVVVEETMCIAKGDPYCEFIVRPLKQ